MTPEEIEFWKRIQRHEQMMRGIVGAYCRKMDTVDVQGACALVNGVADETNALIEHTKPWKLNAK